MNGILIRRRTFGYRDRNKGRRPCDNGGRHWRDVVASQGIPRIACNQRSEEEAGKKLGRPLPSNLQRAWPC